MIKQFTYGGSKGRCGLISFAHFPYFDGAKCLPLPKFIKTEDQVVRIFLSNLIIVHRCIKIIRSAVLEHIQNV